MDAITGHIRNLFGLKDSSIPDHSLLTFTGIAISIAIGIIASIVLEEPLLLGLPAGLLLVYQTIVDFRKVFFLLMFTLPLSMEYYFPGGFGTDLPTEPLLIGLMLAYFLYLLSSYKKMSSDFLLHPITLLLLLHLVWMTYTTLHSDNFIVSLKFMLAKGWYVVGYFFLAGTILKTKKDFMTLFWVIFIPFTIAIAVTLVRHSTYGFSFMDVNYVMRPCFRNHVLYAAIMAVFFPYLFIAARQYKTGIIKWILVLSIPFYLIAIYLSFTRTAYIALILAFGSYFIIRFRLIKPAIIAASIGIVLGVGYMLNDNKYLDYAPEFDKTITHYNFDNLVDATAKGEDVSTMERVYRWVAAIHMNRARFWTGFGPGNFYNFYKGYTVNEFETYVSDNPEKSGIHNYYLMMLVDQGLPGAIIFLILSFFILIKGENIYHQTRNKNRKYMVMMVLLSIIIIDAFLIINDMLETDKVGAFYFINLALLINFDLKNKEEALSMNNPSNSQ